MNYNLAKGYIDLYAHLIKTSRINAITFPGNENHQKAKKYFRQALNQIAFAESSEQPKILTDYGNCLDDIGRSLEALMMYSKALEINSCFKMALGNKAIAMRRFANIAGKFRGALFIEAYQTFRKIVDDHEIIKNGGIVANMHFKTEMGKIEKMVNDKSKLNADLRHVHYSEDGLSEFEKFYLSFCSQNNLFLHLHIHDNTCNAAIVDSVFINILEPKGKNRLFMELSKITNQIKEDFMTARLLLVESLYRKDDYDRISERTTLVNIKDDSLFHIYTGLLKAAYRLTYDILDKIARFINDYIKLGMNPRKINFMSIWGEREKIKEPLLKTRNISLYALYDVYLDLKNDSNFRRLKLIRDSLVHRLLILYGGEKSSYDNINDCNKIGWDVMINKTIQLMYLLKSAIIYMINFVQIEEMRKASKLKGAIINRVEPDTKQNLEHE